MNTLYLIRHGDYDQKDPLPEWEGKPLLKAGREQAKLTGERLQKLISNKDKGYCSDFTRARETAEIITCTIDGFSFEITRDIRECDHKYYQEFDAPPSKLLSEILSNPNKHFGEIEGNNIVVVCHANLIRYYVCKLFDLNQEQWKGLYVGNCSLTTLIFPEEGKLDIDLLVDEEHIPENLRT